MDFNATRLVIKCSWIIYSNSEADIGRMDKKPLWSLYTTYKGVML